MEAAKNIMKGASKFIKSGEVRWIVSAVRCRPVVNTQWVLVTRQDALSCTSQKYYSTGIPPSTEEQDHSQLAGNENSYSLRTHTCGELRGQHKGCHVLLFGWIEFIRYDKFLVLRDAYGSTQILISHLSSDLSEVKNLLTFESVIKVEGTVVMRPPDQINSKMSTGEIEIAAKNITLLDSAPQCLPFNIRKFQNPSELLSMQYRYLYLRYPHMQKTLRLRSLFLHQIRCFLVQKQFVDVETPTLFRRTPGGAQEFVVPTQRRGLFYSLVQSPQQFKQLLMVGGLDRYFQIARCYRDESTRPDRQPEFTQLDIELSFVDREGVMSMIEDLLVACWPDDLKALSKPFPRMSFLDAFSQYGSDKPDMRFGSKIIDVTHLAVPAESTGLKNKFDDKNFSLQLVTFPKSASIFSQSQWKEMGKEAQVQWSALDLFLLPFKHAKDISKVLGCFVSEKSLENILSNVQVERGDLIILGLGPRKPVLEMLGAMRIHIADCLEAHGHPVRSNDFHFSWIVDFPLFEENSEGGLNSAHHPFTQPHPEDLHFLNTNPLKVRGLHYDLVLNGAEVGGGSIRISNAELQKRILNLLNIKADTLQHLLNALSMGCPPHGGIALGIDRLIASICRAKSIREVIAFPKGSNGQDIMSDAPSPLSDEDAKLYGLPAITTAAKE